MNFNTCRGPDYRDESGADPRILKGGSGGIFFKRGGGGGATTYSGAICIANKQKSCQKGGGSGPPGHPPGSAPVSGQLHFTFTCLIVSSASLDA